MKRFNIYISIIFIFLAVMSCEKEYKAPGPAATKLYCVVPRNSTQIHEPLYFGDLSSNVSSRTWRFPSKNVNIVDSDNNTTSDKSIVSAIFSEPGLYDVSLHIEFNEALIADGSYTGRTRIDTTFTITIIDSVKAYIRANYVHYEDKADSVEMDLNATNKLWGGESVRFTSLMHGGPTDYLWWFEGGNPEFYEGTDSAVLVQYPSLGTFSVGHIAYRTDPPSIDTSFFENIIEVTPSNRAASLFGAKKTGRTTIELTFSQNVEDPSAEVQYFSLNVQNVDPIEVGVASLEKHSSVESKIIVTTDAPIYDDDTITISYADGNFANAYEGIVGNFTDEKVEPNYIDIIPDGFDPGFEQTPTTWVYGGWDGDYSDIYYDFELSTEEQHTGKRSMRVRVDAGRASAVASPVQITFEAGKQYRYGGWIKSVAIGNDFHTATIWPAFFVVDVSVGVPTYLSTEWTYVYRDFDCVEDLTSTTWLRVVGVSSEEELVIHYDDMFYYELELRP